MQARLGNIQLICNVSIAESVEAAGLDKALGDIQDLLRGVDDVGFLVQGALPRIRDSSFLNSRTIEFYLPVDKLPINR